MSEPLAWLLTNGAGTAIKVFLSESGAKRYASSNGMGKFPVTPLVAAPPEDGRPTWAEVRAVLKDAVASLHRPSLAWQRANNVLSRIPREEP